MDGSRGRAPRPGHITNARVFALGRMHCRSEDTNLIWWIGEADTGEEAVPWGGVREQGDGGAMEGSAPMQERTWLFVSARRFRGEGVGRMAHGVTSGEKVWQFGEAVDWFVSMQSSHTI
jgi:hypothetical protein